jgi:squalene cyclase
MRAERPKGDSVKSPAKKSAPDVLVANAGTVFTFCPLTTRAKEWIEENVQDDAQWFGHALVVEHRYAWGLAQGLKDAGLVLQ